MSAAPQRARLSIHGAVQGVGFRPFVYRLATELELAGWVLNSAGGVEIEVEAERATLERFVQRLADERPPHAFVQSSDLSWHEAVGLCEFEIRASQDDRDGQKTALILPDLATCADCRREILDPADRRHRYPFTNCTNCGPRFSIIRALPYDRPATTMAGFTMCPACRHEYEDPGDRRFHAQPNACPECGPQLAFWNATGAVEAKGDGALLAAVAALRAGRIVAVKGLGGFHLMVLAGVEDAVARLRRRKGREEKPLALMMPDIAAVETCCKMNEAARALLTSPQAPIVLLRRRVTAEIAASVAPGNPQLGVMLPYTPLHLLMMAELGAPLVATSGNLSDEPICIDEGEALERLGSIADCYLVHDRPIQRHVDDSIVRVAAGRTQMLRRARGYAPLPITLADSGKGEGGGNGDSDQGDVLAVGAHLKNTVALAIGRDVFVSQHIGDLETAQAAEAFGEVAAHLQQVYTSQPACVACDLHPDYLSTLHARESGLPLVPVQHHLAHVLACLAENECTGPALGVAWDGTGLGCDGTIWGGEFIVIDAAEPAEAAGEGSAWRRAATLRSFPLPGGEQAIKEPRRTALGLLYEMDGPAAFQRLDLPPIAAFDDDERRVLAEMLASGLNCPRTSSAGRLFDAVASLLDLHQVMSFEGQAAMALEWTLPRDIASTSINSFPLVSGGDDELQVLDWAPMIRAILALAINGAPASLISLKFHETLVEAIVEVARKVGLQTVALSGGCFQNRYLLDRSVDQLREAGFRPLWHRLIPPNDGGIALGQVVAARRGIVSRIRRD